MNKRFDLEAAKNGEPILFDGRPAAFIVHLPDNDPAYRVVLSCSGHVHAFTEDGRYCEAGESRLTMASRTEKTIGYRSYYSRWLDKIIRACLIDGSPATPELVERQKGFIAWIDHEWQYDEVEL